MGEGAEPSVGASAPPVDLTLHRSPPATPPKLDRWQVEELVDTVVARIERRVVEELERRGHWRTPGGL